MKKQILTLIIGLAGIMSIHAQISEAKNALKHTDKHFFIENKGQWPDEVLYLTRIGSLDAWICKNGVLYDFYKLEEVSGSVKTEKASPNKFEQKDYTRTGHKVWYKLQGNNTLIHTDGKEKQTGYYNYLIGNDPGKHASNVGLYKEVLVKNVYNGIDIRYYFDKGNIRYDYIVHPGADPSQIAFVLEGTDKIHLNPEGDLVFNTRFGEKALAELRTYQGTRANKIASSFVKTEKGWGIALGHYDSKQTLIIDPLIYSTYLGGSGQDQGNSISVDALGNAYIMGITSSTNYHATSGAYQTSLQNGWDVFVTKLNAAGTALVYSTYLGGSGDDQGASIAIDASGNAYVVGSTSSTNYNITSGAYQTSYAGGDFDVFVTKLNATGTALVYSTYLGGSDFEYGFSITIDASGNAYLTGTTVSSNYDITTGAYQASIAGSSDVFVTKLNTTGTALVYSTYLGGSNSEQGNSIAIDDSDNVYVAGFTGSSNYDITSGAYQTSLAGGFDVFVTKLNTSGTALVYSTLLGGSGTDVAYSIATNADGNAFVTGSASTGYDITSGAYQTIYAGGSSDVFVTKLNTTGTALVYSTYLGGSDADYAYSTAVDVSGNAYVTGYTMSSNYDTTSGAYQTSYTNNWDVFVTKLNATGTALVYSTYLGGQLIDQGNSIATDASGSVYITGRTGSSNFDITSGAYQTSYAGSGDVFVIKICLGAISTVKVNLSSNAGTDMQNVCINNAIANIAYASTNASYATVTGLPTGVKGSFASDTFTISGTSVESGTFDYTVILSGACNIVTAQGRITVKPDNSIDLSSNAGTDSQSVCIHTAITSIIYDTKNASGATVTGLPTGVTGSFVANLVIISGTPVASGTFNYTITLTGGCGTITAKGSIIVKPENTISLSSALGTDVQNVQVNNSIANITYATTGASGATVTGLPAGVTGSFAADVVTISGTPSTIGTFPFTVNLTGGCGDIKTTGSIHVGSVGITDQANRQALQIFPNPSDIEVSINGFFTATVQIEIIDALGRISQAVYMLDKNTIKLQVSSLENGIYCIRIIDNDQVFQSKIIVQH